LVRSQIFAAPAKLGNRFVKSKISTINFFTASEPRRIRVEEPVWEYSRWGNAGYVDVHFDEAGRLQSVNDESVFP
jgi:hypothetical protein